MEEKHWGKWCKTLPEGYTWERVDAQRVSNKGRAKGAILFGVKKKDGVEEWKCTIKNNVIQWRGCCQEKELSIVAVYNAVGWEKLQDELKEMVEGDNVHLLVVGDMNARMGEEKLVIVSDETEIERRSKDLTTNAGGIRMMNWLEEAGLIVLNGWKMGDEGGAGT